MPLFRRNISEPTLTTTPVSPPPHLNPLFSYSHGVSQTGSINSGSSSNISDSPVPVFNPAEHLSKQELQNTISAHKKLIDAAALYREKSVQLAAAAAGLGTALEHVAKEKAATESGQGLQAAAGLQFLVSNHHLLLANLISTAFEGPLIDNLHQHSASIEHSQQNYETAMKTMNKKIGETEIRSLKKVNRKKRDLREFRRVLQDLTQQIDELERVKVDYSRYVFETERRNHQFILNKVSGLVRAQVDIYERISSKGLMVTSNPDPFCAYPTSDESKAIFSVLPPISLIDATASSTLLNPLDFQDSVSNLREDPPTPPPKDERIQCSLSSTHLQPTEHIPAEYRPTSYSLSEGSSNSVHSRTEDGNSVLSTTAELNAVHDEEDESLACFRTDYSDEEQWQTFIRHIEQDDHHLSSYLRLQSNSLLDGNAISELCRNQRSNYILVADSRTMADETVAVVHCETERSIRFHVHDLWIVASKASELDQYFGQFEQNIDVNGVFSYENATF